jgi:hypothetical protein
MALHVGQAVPRCSHSQYTCHSTLANMRWPKLNCSQQVDRELFLRPAKFRENSVVGLPTSPFSNRNQNPRVRDLFFFKPFRLRILHIGRKIVNMKNSRDLFVPKVFSSSEGNIVKTNKSKEIIRSENFLEGRGM